MPKERGDVREAVLEVSRFSPQPPPSHPPPARPPSSSPVDVVDHVVDYFAAVVEHRLRVATTLFAYDVAVRRRSRDDVSIAHVKHVPLVAGDAPPPPDTSRSASAKSPYWNQYDGYAIPS